MEAIPINRGVDPTDGSSGHFPTIRRKIAVLVLACVLPSLLGLGLLVFHFYQRERAQLEADAIQTARALMAAVDRDLSIGEDVALALAESPNIQHNDIAAFHSECTKLLRDEFPGFTFVLSDRNGQQILNAIRPFGEPLPRHGNPEQLRRLFETGKPIISDVFIGGVTKHPLVAIDVPVWRDGKVMYDLSVGFLPERLGKILTEQRLPPDRVVAVLDSKGVIVARTHDPEKFVGGLAAPKVVERVREAEEGVIETTTLEGIPTFANFSRSTRTGWSVVIGIPRKAVLGKVLRSVAGIALAVLALLALGCGVAWSLGGRIGRSVQALIAPALALGSGRPVVLPAPYFKEAVDLANALKKAEGELDRYRSNAVRQHAELTVAKTAADRSTLAKSKFLAAASHDLRQPVQSLVFLLEVLKRHANTPAVAKAVGAMEGALDGLNGLLTNILDISRIDAGVVTPRMRSVDASAIIRRLAGEYAPLCQHAGIRLRCHSKAELHAHTDATLLERIVRNLIENAIRYTRHGGILIAARRRGGHLRIDVVDSGIGIPKDKLPEIFEEFFQVANPARDYKQGLGLGLAIVERLGNLIGARVQVRSTEGQGSWFTVTLPLGTAGQEVSVPPGHEASVRPGRNDVVTGRRFLVIEDNHKVRMGLQLLLESWNCQVVVAETSDAAIDAGERDGWGFDAVIADYRLGAGMSGIETAVEIGIRAGRRLPTLIVTGDTAAECIEELQVSGFEWMHKPVTPNELARRLARLPYSVMR